MVRRKTQRRSRTVLAQGKRATIEDVARHAGVGPTTVSRVLRAPEKVSAILKQRVFTAIDQLGYVSNQVASGLASGASRVVPLLIPTLTHSVFVPFLDGLHTELDRHGYEVLLGTTEYHPDNEARLVSTFLGWFPAGVLIAGVDHTPATRRRLERAVAEGIPVIEYFDLAESPLDINIGISHLSVGEAIARFLAGQGYERIGYAGALASLDMRGQRRLSGFVDTLRQLGLPHHYIAQSEEGFSIGLGARLLAQLLDRHPEVDAVFMSSDDMAVGALREARRRGIRVPQDLAIMGNGDVEVASSVEPTITSINVEQAAMGQLAARQLIAALSGTRSSERVINTQFRIVVRDSTPRREPKRS